MDAELYDRRPPGGNSSTRCELPVLFHLRDVSRPKSARPEAAVPTAAAQTFERPPEPLASESLLSALPATADSAVTSQPALYSFLPLEPPAVTLSESPKASLSAVTESQTIESPADPPITGAPPVAAQADPVPDKAAAELLPGRRFKSPPTEQWFATHGKFIAAGFVLALASTVYLARTTRKAAPALSPPMHEAPLLAETPPLKASESSAIRLEMPAPGTPAVATARPIAPAESSNVELQMPIAANTETSPATAERPAGGDSLFVFQSTKRTDERVATRPETPSASSGVPSGSPPQATPLAPSASMPPAYPMTTAPSLYQEAPAAAPSYPRTTAPALPPLPGMPAGALLPGGQVAPPPSGAYSLQGGPPQQSWQPPAGMPTVPGPYQSQDNIARGPRYERTGSGNY